MGIVGTALFLMIILVVVAFGWGYIQDIVFDIIIEGENTFARVETSDIIKVTPTSSETLCDLTITLYPTLVAEESFGSPVPFGIGVGSGLRLDFDPTVKKYQWDDCKSTKTTLASLLNLAGLRHLVVPTPVPASLFCSITNCPFSASAEIVTRITLTDPKTGDILNKFNRGNHYEHVADVGGKQSPVDFNPVFRLEDIPHRNYFLDIEPFGRDDSGTFDLSITVGGGDNGLLISDTVSGKNLRDEVCKSTETVFPCLL